MKTKLILFVSVVLLGVVMGAASVGLTSCCGSAQPKILVAYYSQSGNTRDVAEQIQARFGGNLYEITLATPYPADERETIEIVGQQRAEGVMPALGGETLDLADYDVVFVGTPIWFGTAALPVMSFVEAHAGAWAGKTVIPFYTCGGGDAGTYVADITPRMEGATILEAFGNNRAERTAGTHTEKIATRLEQLKF